MTLEVQGSVVSFHASIILAQQRTTPPAINNPVKAHHIDHSNGSNEDPINVSPTALLARDTIRHTTMDSTRMSGANTAADRTLFQHITAPKEESRRRQEGSQDW